MTTGDRTRPNVLLVTTDQQRWDTVGAYGSPMEITPTLDSLAAQGTKIQQAITPQPLCGPFRACIHTGKYATETGVWRNSIPLDDDQRTLAHYFKSADYDVGFVGSWHLGNTFDNPVPPEGRGGYEDYWVAADIPVFTSHPKEGHLFDEDGNRVEFDTYRADAFTEYAADGIESLEEPFFLVVSYVEPHYQNDMWTFIAPDGYAEQHERDPYIPDDLQNRPGDWFQELPDYYGMVERIDECVDRLLSTLERNDSRENTIVAFTSDHGCHFRTRPGEYKRSPHESAVRVPALLAGPGIDSNRTIDKVTSIVDLPATLIDAAGLRVPDEMQGESLLPVIDGEEPDGGGEAFIQVSESQIGRALRTNRWKYAVAAPTMNGWRGGSGDSTSEVYVERYLYDLHRDPDEQVNLVGRHDYGEVADELRDRLLGFIRNVEDVDPEIRAFENPGYEKY